MSPSAERFAAFLRLWGEVALTGGAALFGLYLFADNASGSLFWAVVGFGLLILAMLNLRGAILRARLVTGGHGPGVVLIDEGEIAYMGPETGGIAPLDAITRIALCDPGSGPALVIIRRANAPITIPLAAQGADGLIDALAALPRFDPALMAAARSRAGPVPETIWARGLDLTLLAGHP